MSIYRNYYQNYYIEEIIIWFLTIIIIVQIRI